MLIEMNVGEMGGVQDVSIDLAKGMTTVTFDDALASVDDIVAQIESAGYGVER
jgi:copper chaperone CopZ